MAMATEAWETLKRSIEAYTGLSPAIFFTVLAVASAIYYALAGFFAPPPPPPRRRDLEVEIRKPVELGEISEEELRAYDGSDPQKPLLMAIKGQIFDVTQGRMFYGPGGPYALFAGRDASRALAKMSFEPEDLTSDLSGLGPFELDALQDWEYKFQSKYYKVGTVKKTVPVSDGSDETAPEQTGKIAEATENADIQADRGAQTEKKTSSMPSDEDTEEDLSEKHGVELKENGLSSESEVVDHPAESKEI